MGLLDDDHKYKPKIEKLEKQIADQRKEHRKALEKMEERKKQEIKEKREKESELEKKQKKEKEDGNKKLKELENRKMEELKKNISDLTNFNKSNGSKHEELLKKNAHVLMKDRDNERADKIQMAERNDAQKNLLEDLQKDALDEMHKKAQAAQEETISMLNDKMEDLQNYSDHKYEITEEHRSKMEDLLAEQNDEEYSGKEQQHSFEVTKGEIKNIQSISEKQRLEALKNDQNYHMKVKLIDDIKKASKKLLDNVNEIGRKANGRSKNSDVQVAMIFRLVQNCQQEITSLSTELTSVPFLRIDDLDEERKEISGEAIERIQQLSMTFQMWTELKNIDSLPADDLISEIKSSIENVQELADTIHTKIFHLPQPEKSDDSIPEVVFSNCEMITQSLDFD